MSEYLNHKQFDLEQLTQKFAKEIRDYIKELPQSISNREYEQQIIRSSGSVAANYIEANEALSKKDFAMRIKICRKEAKETELWLNMLEGDKGSAKQGLLQECIELRKIFGSIVQKVQ